MNAIDANLINKYFADDCSEAELELIFEWINASESNRKQWLRLRTVSARSVFQRCSDPEHLDSSFKELLKKQHSLKCTAQKKNRKIAMRFMRYAASALAIIGLSIFCFKHIFEWQRPEMVVVYGETDHVKQVTLEDSSQVWLSSGSRIEYPRRFGKKERKVSVEGKVLFHAAKDIHRPFLVETDAYTVKVLGTVFEVNALKDSQTSDVTLVDGKVEILDSNHTFLCSLLPGQQFELFKINNRFNLHQVQAEMITSWSGGTLEFDGLTFTEIVKLLERQYNIRIITGEGVADDLRLVGSLSLQKNITQMLRTLELVMPINYQMPSDTVVYINVQK